MIRFCTPQKEEAEEIKEQVKSINEQLSLNEVKEAEYAEKIREIIKRLKEIYEIRTFLDEDPYKVLVRTILSQRTRDENTDQATNALFEVFPDIYAVADAPTEEVQKLIKPAGFYRVKAGRIQEVSQILIDQYGGEVPNDMDELLKLPGVGRKTANLMLGDVFRVPGSVVVDTHCIRLSNRIGLVDGLKEPEKIERILRKELPPENSSQFCHCLVLHGRAVCDARKPVCEACCIRDLCEYGCHLTTHTQEQKEDE